jgi:hypothetical protein
MNHKVIDNFMDEEYFDSLLTLFTDKGSPGYNHDLPWFFQGFKPETRVGKMFYMQHMFYDGNVPFSPHYEKMIPLLKKLNSVCLIRIKANFYPNTETIIEHPMHIDFDYCHAGAIFSLNTCDGYTKLKDGTKIDSVANRILLFDPTEEHCSTTTTNVPARININFNYINEEQSNWINKK